jgi:hypothetical protein
VDERNKRFRSPGIFYTDAHVAGAGVLGFSRGDECLLRAVIWRIRGRAPELVFPSRREEGDLPTPESTRLVGQGGEVLAASSEASGLMLGALLVSTRGALKKERDIKS